MTTRPNHAVCVFCGSSSRVDARFLEVGARTGSLLAEAGFTLVYGGGGVGIMHEVAKGVHAGGGRVVGVIPQSMVEQELAYRAADELIVTDNMRQRKAVMDERSDAFITLPGGFGTLEELSEVITHRLLAFHDKPIVLVNTDGFYDPLQRLFEHFVEHHFARPKHMETFRTVATPEEAIAVLRAEFDARPSGT